MPHLDDIQSKYSWDVAAGRYRGPDGRFVSFGAVRQALDDVLDRTERDVMSLASNLRSGNITISEWQIAMRDTLKDIHVASGALAQGGWAQMSPSDYGRVGRELRNQYQYLSRFARQIERGLALDGRFTRRVRLYAQSGRTTYHLIERVVQLSRGRTEERNILGGNDHCRECVAETAKGWVPIGELDPVGTRICKSNCRCSVEYR